MSRAFRVARAVSPARHRASYRHSAHAAPKFTVAAFSCRPQIGQIVGPPPRAWYYGCFPTALHRIRSMSHESPTRRPSWKWIVCGLLLCATMLNYMDRLTLNQTSLRIMEAFDLDEEGYGLLETVFSVAFGLGAIGAGFMVDRWNVWWIYPAAVLAWSLAGVATGFVETLAGLYLCRAFLGLMESGHWPCALRTTQRLLTPQQRTLGNSILQSGAALGSIFTPLLVIAFLQW